MREEAQVFFVLNGLHNGVEGEFATTAGFEKPMKDGWYWLRDDGNPDGVGPFESRQAAKQNEEEAP